jgi:hypothetical protein
MVSSDSSKKAAPTPQAQALAVATLSLFFDTPPLFVSSFSLVQAATGG